MNQKNKKLMMIMTIFSILLFAISIIIMDDISFLFAGIATILLGITLFLVIHEVTNYQKTGKSNKNDKKKKKMTKEG